MSELDRTEIMGERRFGKACKVERNPFQEEMWG
jgi:hypothetical protein